MLARALSTPPVFTVERTNNTEEANTDDVTKLLATTDFSKYDRLVLKTEVWEAFGSFRSHHGDISHEEASAIFNPCIEHIEAATQEDQGARYNYNKRRLAEYLDNTVAILKRVRDNGMFMGSDWGRICPLLVPHIKVIHAYQRSLKHDTEIGWTPQLHTIIIGRADETSLPGLDGGSYYDLSANDLHDMLRKLCANGNAAGVHTVILGRISYGNDYKREVTELLRDMPVLRTLRVYEDQVGTIPGIENLRICINLEGTTRSVLRDIRRQSKCFPNTRDLLMGFRDGKIFPPDEVRLLCACIARHFPHVQRVRVVSLMHSRVIVERAVRHFKGIAAFASAVVAGTYQPEGVAHRVSKDILMRVRERVGVDPVELDRTLE